MKRRSMHSPDACTACTICVAHCPVALATMKFRGPKLTGPAYERFRLLGFGDEASLEYCSNCKNCDISCPSGVAVATFNMLARDAYCRGHTPPPRDWVLAHSGDLGKLAALMPAPLLNFGMANPLSRLAMHIFGIEKRAPLPRFGSLRLRRELARYAGTKPGPNTVVFFPGCFIRYYDPQTGLDCIRLLEMAGHTVIVPGGFECCGLPLVAGGYAEDARDKARVNCTELARWTGRDIPVLTACPSCALMLKHEYEDLFPGEGFNGYASQVLDICDYIADLIRTGSFSLPDLKTPLRVAYHAPCHLRAQGAGRTGLDLLRLTGGVEAVDMDAGCCGISGSYGFKRGKYEIGMTVGAALFHALKTSDAQVGASECGTCRVQMLHGSGMRAEHPVSIVLRAASENGNKT